ncbi:MAG TPA: beta-ketoacyl synthase N-terminal-like domain-containing protein [Thermoanaerobaculia bacterium]|nr:beta-ketoacyl synthase N-terminal-like domain-containing protein [Thermoanaerobaculia bacterium]
MSEPRRVGVFGWGIVAPLSRDVDAFARNLESPASWLRPFDGYGPSNFLVGAPAFDFADYKPWIDARHPPSRYPQLAVKMDSPTQYAIGAFIQALGQNPGIEAMLRELGDTAHIYVGTSIGAVATIGRETIAVERAQRRWDRFWATPERNAALRAWQVLPDAERTAAAPGAPADPATVPDAERSDAEDALHHYWAARSPQLLDYLAALREIESLAVEGDVAEARLHVLKEKQRRRQRLQADWGAPTPPWSDVSADPLWNIHNNPAAQISMLGRITGLAFAPVAACSTFGVALKHALDAIRRGEATAVVVGATDPPPLPISVGAFNGGRVATADGEVSKPLTGLRGAHVSGGAAVWIVGDLEAMTARGFRPLGMEPLAVATSSDAEHIISPSHEGPLAAIRRALALAGAAPADVATWDMHATGTPGDVQEIVTLRTVLPETVLVTARKGTFGHGMGPCGGWELTAQYLGYARGELFPTPLRREELHPSIAAVHERFVFDQPLPAPPGLAGKLSMGIGGVNACVISRPWM